MFSTPHGRPNETNGTRSLGEPFDAGIVVRGRRDDEGVDVGAVAQAAELGDLVVGVARREQHDAHPAFVGLLDERVQEAVEDAAGDAVGDRVEPDADRRADAACADDARRRAGDSRGC